MQSKAAGNRKSSAFERFVVADLDGQVFDVTPEDFVRCPVLTRTDAVYQRLRQFIANELAERVSRE